MQFYVYFSFERVQEAGLENWSSLLVCMYVRMRDVKNQIDFFLLVYLNFFRPSFVPSSSNKNNMHLYRRHDDDDDDGDLI